MLEFPFARMVAIAVGGALGALARYGLASVTQARVGVHFPFGTMLVNLAGCFLFGLLWGVLEKRLGSGSHYHALLFTGFLGAFTTFSTFAFETAGLMRGAQWHGVAVNVLVQMLLGVTLIFVGLGLGRMT